MQAAKRHLHIAAQRSLRANGEHIADDQQSDYQLWIDRRPTTVGIMRRQLGTDPRQVENRSGCCRDLCWNWVTRSPAFREYRVRPRGQLADRWMFWQASANRQPFAC